jgi:dethiobiotin synthetase
LRPERLVVVCGTGTEVGKTWVAARLIEELRGRGQRVCARKPAQSFDVDAGGVRMGGPTDGEVLGKASGEDPAVVCHPVRSYRRAMAPPMAAEALGLPPFTVDDLVAELIWPDPPADVGLVELAGGVLSPQAADGDATHMVRALRPELVVLVSDAGLGTINGVRMSMGALAGTDTRVVVALDRFDARHDIHRRNLEWLAHRDGFDVVTLPGGAAELADRLLGP